MPEKTSRTSQRVPRKARSPKAIAMTAEAAKAERYIADQLKALYDTVTVEPIPDRLMQLLDRLDKDAKE
jgi:hypothetical protein